MSNMWKLFILWMFLINASAQESQVLDLDICDLAQHPQQYAGKVLRVAGQVSSGWVKRGRPIKKFAISQPFGSLRCITELAVVVPDQLKPKIDFDLVRDESYGELEKALRTSMTVGGTFRGRFDFRPSDKTLVPGSKTSKTIAGRLVLERVLDVESHVLYGP